MKRILFIGGAGFIGSSIIRAIQDQDYVISVLEPQFADLHRLEGLNFNIYRGDLQNIDYIYSILDQNDVDIVVHLVSNLIPSSSFEEYKNEFKTVIFPSIQLMQFCSQRNIRFVYFSSGGTIYGNRKTDVPFVETDPMEPISYYGWSKQIMENSILYVHRTAGLKYLILRPSNPYGNGQKIHAQQGLIAVAIGNIINRTKISVWGDGSSIRDYIYIDDMARIVSELLRLNTINKTLNLGSNKGYSVNDILNILRDIVSEPIEVEYLVSRNVDVTNMVLNTDELRKIVNIKLTPIEDGIKHFYNDIKLS